MKKIKINFFNKGFTLLELLVVIGIIGILMALATVAYSTTQVGGRNSRRKQDMVAIQNALEQYYADNGYAYPDGSCVVAATYMKSNWPVDPSSTIAVPVNYEGTTNCSATVTPNYCICAVMEGATNTSGNSGAACAWNTDKSRYCVSNLQ